MNCKRFFWIIFWFWAVFPSDGIRAQEDQTLLMFVGEDQDVLSIASGREESAWKAPAVVKVIEQEEFRENHSFSLTKAMNSVPGFHGVNSASGVRSYLRGIPESVLYLYDTVPMTFTDDISLHSFKQIEIVRGPGSVLWGPDAFAGIVNLVPLTGKDLTGTETGAFVSSDNDMRDGAYIHHGWDRGLWDGFLSFSASTSDKKEFSSDITRFWGTGEEPVPADERRGSSAREAGRQAEIAGNFSYGDVFKVSGRFSDSTTPYSFSYQDNISWKQTRQEKSGFLKLEGKHQFNIDSALRFTATASVLDAREYIIDTRMDHDEYETYGEITYEKVFNSGGSHFTAGVSARNKTYDGVALWDTYLPEYLTDENDYFIPTFTQKNYSTRLFSVFAQYRKTLGKVDLIFGLRHDDHDSFGDKLSYNTGLVWTPREDWVLKASTGTAYRTPSPRQLFYADKTDPEEIKNMSLEISRKIGQKAELSLGGFINKISDHVMDDAYAGLSSPNSQDIKGIEFSCSITPIDEVTLSAAFTRLFNQGPLETYLYNDYSTLLPDGTWEKHYVLLEYPYDSGPEQFWRAGLVWSPTDTIEIFTQARYFSGYPLIYPRAEDPEKSSSAFLVDAGIRIKNVFMNQSDLEINITNVLDREYTIPGEYSLEKGAPFSMGIMWRKRW